MKTLKIKYGDEIPKNYTGIVEFEYGYKCWLKNGLYHREDGPAKIRSNGSEEWWLAGKWIWDSSRSKIDLRNCIILSKETHPEYPTVQVWKWLNEYRVKEKIIISGMEKFING